MYDSAAEIAGAGISPPGRSPLASSFLVGRVTVRTRVVLGPMAGITNSAFRRHLKRYGVGLVSTEMVSSSGLLYGNRRTLDYLIFRDEERPLAVQLFGSCPEVIAEAACRVAEQDRAPEIIDLNMGCPVRKVMKTGAGAALLGDPARAVAVAAATVRALRDSRVEVTVKLRSGLVPERTVARELAPRLEEAGVAAIILHPRSASQLYAVEADHGLTADIAASVGIPVIASGDMTSAAVANRLLADTRVAAVMVARGVQGNPWLVEDMIRGEDRERPPLAVVLADLGRLLDAAEADLGPVRAGRWVRRHLGWYLRRSGVPRGMVDELRQLPEATALRAAFGWLSALLEDNRVGLTSLQGLPIIPA